RIFREEGRLQFVGGPERTPGRRGTVRLRTRLVRAIEHERRLRLIAHDSTRFRFRDYRFRRAHVSAPSRGLGFVDLRGGRALARDARATATAMCCQSQHDGIIPWMQKGW